MEQQETQDLLRKLREEEESGSFKGEAGHGPLKEEACQQAPFGSGGQEETRCSGEGKTR
jgi:hypothetical protein